MLSAFGKPDWVIFNSGEFPANILTKGMSSKSSICIDFKRGEFVILGTQYAGEMKKGVFTIMNYLMPKLGQLSLHSSANEGADGKVNKKPKK
jgi:phosphoenolpyruvate carboxykinase (ATP)